MIFDLLCRIAEGSMSGTGFRKILESARLFKFEGNAHEFLPRERDKDTTDFLWESFHLPFPCVAIEDNAGVVILKDMIKNAVGLFHERRFIDCVYCDAKPEAFGDGYSEGIAKGLPRNCFYISMGMIKYVAVNGIQYEVEGALIDVYVATEAGLDSVGQSIIKRWDAKRYGPIYRNAATAIEEVMILNTPDRFILEERPAAMKIRKGKSKPKIPRSHERPIYTLLKPAEIRARMGLPSLADPTADKRTSPRPHERRAHVRTLKSARYRKAQGKRIFIPAQWIGPSESTYNGRRYRVLLNR